MALRNLLSRYLAEKVAPAVLPKRTLPVPAEPPDYLGPSNWALKDEPRFYEVLGQLIEQVHGGVYASDNLVTWGRNNSALGDGAFREAFESNIQGDSDRAILWRRYILACAGYHCVQLEGDFVECGVYRGTGIKTVIDYLGGKAFPKRFFGYDTYDYHPVEGHRFEGQKEGLYEQVQARFEGYEQVTLVKGLIPESFATECPARIAYLHIDLNSAEGEIAALEILFDRVVPGGVIILDDYEWAGIYRIQKVAEDAWFDKRRYRVFPLPTGQGLVLKR